MKLIIIGSVVIVLILIIIIVIAVVVKKQSDIGDVDDTEDTSFKPSTFEQLPASKINTNLQKWTKMRLVNQEQYENGNAGGEGCQWPTSLACDSDDGNFILYGTDVSGFWKSLDGGITWFQSNNGHKSCGVGSIAIDPKNKNHVVTVGNGGKFESGIEYSYDQGQTWNRKQKFSGIYGSRYLRDSLAFDPSSYDSEKGICMRVYFSTPYQLDCDIRNGENLNPVKSANNLFNETTSGFYISTDGGETFVQQTTLAPDGIIRVSKDGNYLFIGTQKGVYYSNDHGKSLQKLSHFQDDEISGIDLVDNNLYVQTFNGIWLSTDYGSTFTEITLGSNYPTSKMAQALKVCPINISRMAITARNVETVYYQTFLYYSHDSGKTWNKWTYDRTSFFHFGDSNCDAREKVIIWNPINQDKLLTFGVDNLLMSTDGGIRWHSPGQISNIMLGAKLTFNYYDTTLLSFGAQDYHGAYTLNGGLYWIPFFNMPGNQYGLFMPDEKTVIGTSLKSWSDGSIPELTLSFDAGKTSNLTGKYVKSAQERRSIQTIQSFKNPETIFVGQYKSIDNGKTFEIMNECDQVFCMNLIEPHEIYGQKIGDPYVIVSYDEGITWKKVNENNPFPDKWGSECTFKVFDMSFDQVNRLLYVIYYTKGKYDSKDMVCIDVDSGNVTFLTDNIPTDYRGSRRIDTCVVDPHYTDLIYIGGSGDYFLNDKSVLRSLDRGKTWEVINTNSENDQNLLGSYGHQVYTIRINYTNGEVLLGSSCYGFYKLSPPYDPNGLNEKVTYHKIVYVTNGGEEIQSDFIANRRFLRPITPTKNGFVFLGWYKDEELSEPFDFENTHITNSIKLYAKWRQSFSVTFIDIDGKLIGKVTQDNEEPIQQIDPPSHRGYVFANYFYDKDITKEFDHMIVLDEDITLYAGYYKTQNETIYPNSDDYNGYLEFRSDNVCVPVFLYDNETKYKCDIDEEVKNRIVPFIDMEYPKNYLITMKMDTRFRGGVTATNRLRKWWQFSGTVFVNKYDVNGNVSVGRTQTQVVNTTKDCRSILVFYYSEEGNSNWKEIRNTIQLNEIVDRNILFEL
ncbi:pA14 domain protein [Histomonas meleagridis]|uniref:pA14 domain protein n=1 Tax=Histomonas meleagridis TaxID=135588 RepID=UPI003559B6FE|nr:pA14 domain protein [Histomonas meleagridis]KAH0797252.1 pA14 domain protein [Histomonas meleagridis]